MIRNGIFSYLCRCSVPAAVSFLFDGYGVAWCATDVCAVFRRDPWYMHRQLMAWFRPNIDVLQR